MSFAHDETLSRACRILFGQETAATPGFLFCLQPSGISKAFRRRALATHPDRLVAADETAKKRTTELFIEADWARERLISFCRNRDNAAVPLAQLRKKAASQNRSRNYPGPGRNSQYCPGILPQRRLFFGEFLYYSGAVTWNAFIKAIVWQRRQRPRFGEIARRWRYISEHELRLILARKRFCEPIGETAVRMNSLSRFQVNTILFHQMFIQKPIGEFFVERGYLTRGRIDELLRDFKKHNSKFPEKP